MEITVSVSRYLKDTGVALKRMCNDTGLSYNAIYKSLGPTGTRKLRADELLTICNYIHKEPMSFRDHLESA